MEENKDFFAETENNRTSAETNNDAAETPAKVKGTINVIAGEDGPTAVLARWATVSGHASARKQAARIKSALISAETDASV